jgi:hypothetical protein
MTNDNDLPPDTPEELLRLAERLQERRPVPSAAFRGALRRRLLEQGARHERPTRLRARIVAFATSGAGLLVAGALSAAGAGPLGA